MQPVIEAAPDSPASSAVLIEGRPSRYSQLQTLIALIKPETIVEVGTNRGDSAVAMCSEALKHRANVHYTGYDVFSTRDEEFHRLVFNGKGAVPRQFVHDRLESVRSQFPSFTFELIEGETAATLHHQAVAADFVFIDGDHRLEIINRDYAAVAQSRVIVFDDFYDAGTTQGRELSRQFGCNELVARLKHVTILPLADTFPKTGPIRMAVVMREPLVS